MSEQQPTNNVTAGKSQQQYTSLSNKFFRLLVAAVLMIAVASALIYLRLYQVKSTLDDLADESVPTMVKAARKYSQANELANMLEGLVHAESHAFRRIAAERVQRSLETAEQLSIASQSSDFQKTQLKVIAEEFTELETLVELKLIVQQQLINRKLQMLRLHESLSSGSDVGAASSMIQGLEYRWSQKFSGLVAQASEIQTLDRLQSLRELERKLEKGYLELLSLVEAMTPEQAVDSHIITQQFGAYTLGNEGLVSLRIEWLRLNGRAIGRGNFINNLVRDYARMTEADAFQQRELLLSGTRRSAQSLSEQNQILGAATVISILFLLGVLIFVQRKVVKRLTQLNALIRSKSQGQQEWSELGGCDEIAEIADSFRSFVTTIEEQKRQLQALSYSDGLTGIANRRAFDEKLAQDIRSANRHGWSLSVLIMDVDYFKRYNDHYGHAAGDRCLKKVAETLQEAVRRSEDFVARYGGEEFVCILPDTDSKGAEKMAGLIKQLLAKVNIAHEKSDVSAHVTISIGVATYNGKGDEDLSIRELMLRADEALYEAKSRGRNRCVAYTDIDLQIQNKAF